MDCKFIIFGIYIYIYVIDLPEKLAISAYLRLEIDVFMSYDSKWTEGKVFHAKRQ